MGALTTETYLRAIELEGHRPRTVDLRRRQLLRLLVATGGRDPVRARRDHVDAWWDSMAHLAPGTRANNLSAVREYYSWARRTGAVRSDPTDHLRRPRVREGVPRPIPESTYGELLGALPDPWALALMLAGEAGLRAMEVAALDWRDLDLAGSPPSIRVVDGKGGRARVVPAPLRLVAVLRRRNRGRGPVVPRPSDGQAHTAAQLSRGAASAIHAAGQPYSLHQGRHRYGTALLGQGVGLAHIQKLMGHASPTTTALYCQVQDDDLASAVRRLDDIPRKDTA